MQANVSTVINMAVRDVMKKLVNAYAGLTMEDLNVISAIRDTLWIMVNVNLCSNANPSLQKLELLIATIMVLAIKTRKMDSWRSAGVTQASKMTVKSFVVNAQILCLRIPTVSRDIG